MTDTCPHCHRPYAPLLRVNGPMRRRVVDLIASRPDGIGINEIAALVYADRPNDEPNWAANSLKTTVWFANKQLRPQGYRIKSSMGPGAVYRLEKLPHTNPHVEFGKPATAPSPTVDEWQAMWSQPFDHPELTRGNGR